MIGLIFSNGLLKQEFLFSLPSFIIRIISFMIIREIQQLTVKPLIKISLTRHFKSTALNTLGILEIFGLSFR